MLLKPKKKIEPLPTILALGNKVFSKMNGKSNLKRIDFHPWPKPTTNYCVQVYQREDGEPTTTFFW